MINSLFKMLVLPSFLIGVFCLSIEPLAGQESSDESANQAGQETTTSWQEFSPQGGGFQILLPGEPRQVSRTITPQPEMEITIQMFIVSLQEGKVALVAGYHDVQEMPTTDAKRKEILDGGIKGTLVNVVGKMISHEELEVDDAPGCRFTYRGTRKGREIAGHSQLVLNGQRVYQLSIIRLATMESDEALYEKFFSSFKLVKDKK